ncbi:MAG: transporter substrate-binding domain-containing protein [Lachnospiraceae bacterium]|nr:transporter substrate-binding domain-containing protein [Lachnospiraceae bacterium]
MKKRVLSVMLAVAMVLSMTACGSKAEPAPAETEAAATEEAATEAPAEEAPEAESKGSYIIATDTVFAPFEFTDADNNFVGIDVDLLAAIAEDQGFEYELQSLGFDAALLAVESGQADGVIAGMSITEARKEKFDFSDSYYDAGVTMAVAKGSSVASFDDLKDQKVAVKTGTNGAEFAKSIAEQYGFEVVEFSDSPTMYQDVITGNTVACFEDYPVMAYNIQQGAGMEMPGDMNESTTPYGFAVKKGENAELLAMFQAGLANIKANGKYDEIVAKYTK